MQDFNLKEQKQIFKDAWEAGDEASALAAAKAITENAPDSVYGWYYTVVVKTKNFTSLKNVGEDFDEVFEKFLNLSTEENKAKYLDKYQALKTKEEKKQTVKKADLAQKKAPRGFCKVCLSILIAICVIFSAGVIIPSAIYSSRTPSKYYQTTCWDNGAFDAVVFELDTTDQKVIGSIWVNLGGVAKENTQAKITVSSQQTSLTGSFTTNYGGGEKTVDYTATSFGKWVRLAQMTNENSRKYVMLSTKEEVKINEVVFLDKTGKVIKATVKYVGPNDKVSGSLSDTLTHETYNYKVKEAGALINEQGLFQPARVDGVNYLNVYNGLSEREIITLESINNILNGGSYVDDSVNPFGLELMSIGVAIFGGNALGLRIIPMLFTLATIVVLYFVGKQLFASNGYGLFFAILYAISGFALSTAAVGGVEAIFVFFAVMSFWFMYKFLVKAASKREDIKYYLPLVLSGIFFAVAVSVKMQALYLLIALVLIFVLALLKQRKLASDNNVGYARKRNLSIATFALIFIVVSILWTMITYLIGANVYGAYYAGKDLGEILGAVFSMPAKVVSTSYSSGNISGLFANLIGFKAEKLSETQYYFGNTILSIISLASLIYLSVYVILKSVKKSEESLTDSFKNELLKPYIVLCIAFIITLVMSIINPVNAISEFTLTSVFYTGFIVLAVKNLRTTSGKKVALGLSVAEIVVAVLLAFALIVFAFSVPKHLGLLVSSYPLNIGAFRW